MKNDAIVAHANDIYALVLTHLQNLWRDQVTLVPESAPVGTGEPFSTSSVRAYNYVTFNGLRYGSSIFRGGKPYRHAYILNRHPVRIAAILHIKHKRLNNTLPELEHTCAIVQRFKADPDTPVMPWDL